MSGSRHFQNMTLAWGGSPWKPLKEMENEKPEMKCVNAERLDWFRQ